MDKNELITLINPPLWYYQSVPVDLLCASYYLHENNVNHIMRDLNLESLYYFIDYNPSTVQVLNDENKFYNIDELKKCYGDIHNIFSELSNKIYPSSIGWNHFKTQEDLRDINEIEQVIKNEMRNPYISFYENIITSLISTGSRFFAIALFHPDQIIPTFTLCNMIKEKCQDIHIHIFGNLEDQINTKILFGKMNLEQYAKLHKYFDSVSFGNSHKYISEIFNYCTNLQKKDEIAIYKYEDIKISNISDSTILNIPSSRIMPKDILNVIVTGGCYWGQCSFCSIHTHSRYWRENLDHVVNMVEKIASNGRYSIIRFRDCCLSSHDLNIISKEIINRKIKIRWCCRARLEKDFSRELLNLMHKAGCIMVSFGIESFHPVISDKVNKGIDVIESYRIIEDCYKSGIAVKLTALCNYPTETFEQELYNMNELRKVSEFCIDIKINDFMLFDNTDISKNPEKYNIKKYQNSGRHDMNFICDYKKMKKFKDTEIEKIDMLRKDIEAPYSCFMSEEHLLLYLEKYGLKKCMNMIHREK